jgi:hypothetical protein
MTAHELSVEEREGMVERVPRGEEMLSAAERECLHDARAKMWLTTPGCECKGCEGLRELARAA